MFGIGTTELLIIIVVALIVIGPNKLPQFMRSMGKGLAEFRRMGSDVKRTFDAEVDRAEEEHRKEEEKKRLAEKERKAASEPAPAAEAPVPAAGAAAGDDGPPPPGDKAEPSYVAAEIEGGDEMEASIPPKGQGEAPAGEEAGPGAEAPKEKA